jgi:hypothetical protein
MNEYLFGLHWGHLTAAADQIAERHGARHVNSIEPRGERCGWFTCPCDNQFAVANAVMVDIDRAGGIEILRRRGWPLIRKIVDSVVVADQEVV